MSQSELLPAIRLFERRYLEAQKKADALLLTLNIMREEASMPPFKPTGGDFDGDGAASKEMEIKSDTFFGKRQQTAVREYLEMRRASGGDGPATPREIYEALTAGGYKYAAKDPETALVGLRALLRKRSNVFVKVGKGSYGLLSWYPDHKRDKTSNSEASSEDNQDEDSEVDTETESSQPSSSNDE